VADRFLRDNFLRIKTAFEAQPLMDGYWKFFEVEILAPGTDIPFKHNLGYLPKDIIFTSVTKAAVVTFNYEKFDQNFIYFTSDAPCKIRFFAGACKFP
jgi:hypothetical protein